jgi:hypothetical protein
MSQSGAKTMQTQTQTTLNAATPAPATPTKTEVEILRETVNLLDCLSQSGFSIIASIAHLTLRSLEAPSGHHDIGHIANALKAIRDMASDVENSINYESERVGCNYVDEDQRRRREARQAAQ